MDYNKLLGRVVYSKAGRDSGRTFVIVNVIDEIYVYISDGDLRTVEKPKKKKLKHLNITNDVVEEIRELIISGQNLSNSKMKKFLKNRDTI